MDAIDCLERAWLNAQEAVRDYEMYSKRIKEGEISSAFKRFAEQEGETARQLRELLIKYKGQPMDSALHNNKVGDGQ
ncbi:MAG: rubrerythrin [Clostridiaceae bacterium]|nr:rubrerythrin [Clostridiaceae bacterium]